MIDKASSATPLLIEKQHGLYIFDYLVKLC